MSKLGQTWVEFIIATVAFLFIAGFLFFLVSGNFREESEKVQFQTNCLKSQALENFLKNPGEPANWTSSFTVFGLANDSNNTHIIGYNKWLAAKSAGFSNVTANSTPSESWKLKYQIYAFEPATDAACTIGEAITFCRKGKSMNVTANSTADARTEIVLFFPFTGAGISGSSIEASDGAAPVAVDGNGTRVTIVFNTSSTDQDHVNITFDAAPNLIFLEKLVIDSDQKLSFYIGDKLAADEFGAATVNPAGLCNLRTKAGINYTNDTALADFDLLAW